VAKQLPLARALLWIVASTLVVTGSGFAAMKAYLKWDKKRTSDSSYNIATIIQTGPEKEALRTDYLAELMGLSCDKPQNTVRFDCAKAQENLLRSPVIKEAIVKKELPNALHVDYTVRQPVARLFDYTNHAIDEEGAIFPIFPFFSPKNLPELYFGKGIIDREKIKLALALLAQFGKHEEVHVERIDVSKAFAETLGAREIVVLVQEGQTTYHLRLSAAEISDQITHYITLRETLLADPRPCVVDLRIPDLAFLKR
jgi:hypothetical protein